MMCEDCNEREATIRLTTIVNGEKIEKNLCVSCMSKIKQQFPTLELWGFAGLLSSFLDSAKEDKPEPVPDVTCNRCGTTYADFVKSGLLGCSDCYKSFREPLDTLLKGIHGQTRHTGRVPGSAPSDLPLKLSIDRMKQQLAHAIVAEEYETAAGLRDQIRAMSAELGAQTAAKEG